MGMPDVKHARNLILITCLSAVSLSIFPYRGLATQRLQKSYETRHVTIYFNHDDVLAEFGKKIALDRPFLNRNNGDSLQLIRDNIDRIVFRVKMLLDMYPPDFHLNVRVYDTYREIKKIYRDTGMTGRVPAAFYSHESRTVYLSVERLDEGILAHEIAHGIINSYFEPPPPAKTQEILAQYVDRHLWDE